MLVVSFNAKITKGQIDAGKANARYLEIFLVELIQYYFEIDRREKSSLLSLFFLFYHFY